MSVFREGYIANHPQKTLSSSLEISICLRVKLWRNEHLLLAHRTCRKSDRSIISVLALKYSYHRLYKSLKPCRLIEMKKVLLQPRLRYVISTLKITVTISSIG